MTGSWGPGSCPGVQGLPIGLPYATGLPGSPCSRGRQDRCLMATHEGHLICQMWPRSTHPTVFCL